MMCLLNHDGLRIENVNVSNNGNTSNTKSNEHQYQLCVFYALHNNKWNVGCWDIDKSVIAPKDLAGVWVSLKQQ